MTNQFLADCEPDSPYGVICVVHGKQGMSKELYMLQLSDPDGEWKCPIEDCYEQAIFDEERLEKSEGFDYPPTEES